MKVNISRPLIREAFWLLPFVFLTLCALALARPWRTIPPVSEGRAILDGQGRTVIIPEPLPGVVTSTYLSDFLIMTHSPETILKAGGPRERPKPNALSIYPLLFRIFPQVVFDDALWDFPGDIETIAAKDVGGVHLISRMHFDVFGFKTVDFGPPTYEQPDEVIAIRTLILNRLIGQEERAGAIVDRHMRVYKELAAELRPDTLMERPRAISAISPTNEWTRAYATFYFDGRAELINAAKDFPVLGRESDAERILAINPDMIVLYVGDFKGFTRDPRWRGLEAVRNRRVYTNVPFNRTTYDVDGRSLGTRWVAELAYPDRLQPKLRELLRDHYLESYNYRLTEAELDELLNVEENEGAAFYERFLRAGEGKNRDES